MSKEGNYSYRSCLAAEDINDIVESVFKIIESVKVDESIFNAIKNLCYINHSLKSIVSLCIEEKDEIKVYNHIDALEAIFRRLLYKSKAEEEWKEEIKKHYSEEYKNDIWKDSLDAVNKIIDKGNERDMRHLTCCMILEREPNLEAIIKSWGNDNS